MHDGFEGGIAGHVPGSPQPFCRKRQIRGFAGKPFHVAVSRRLDEAPDPAGQVREGQRAFGKVQTGQTLENEPELPLESLMSFYIFSSIQKVLDSPGDGPQFGPQAPGGDGP